MVTIADYLFRNNLNSRLTGVEWSEVEWSGVEWSAVKITMFSTIEPCKSLDSTPVDPDPDSIYQYRVSIADHLFRNSLNSRLYNSPKLLKDNHGFNHQTV